MQVRWVAAIALAALGVAAVAGAADTFYLGLLEEGMQAYERREDGAAAEHLRLACFGLLDDPPLLAVGLTYLALAQVQAADKEGFRATFDRLVEVETRFGAWSQADLGKEIRSRFGEAMARQIPALTLQRTPAFAAFLPPGDGKRPATAGGAGAQRRSERVETPAAPASPAPASPAPGAQIPEGREVAVLDEGERAALSRARSLVASARTVPELERALALGRAVADRHPGSREAQHLVAEIAYRASRWEEAVRYFRAGGEPVSDPVLLFYLAVSLYEVGEVQQAAAVLGKALPDLRRNPFVDAYVEKILATVAAEPGGP